MATTITTDRPAPYTPDGRLEPVAATGRTLPLSAGVRAPRGFVPGNSQAAISQPVSPRAIKSETTVRFAAPRGFLPA